MTKKLTYGGGYKDANAGRPPAVTSAAAGKDAQDYLEGYSDALLDQIRRTGD